MITIYSLKRNANEYITVLCYNILYLHFQPYASWILHTPLGIFSAIPDSWYLKINCSIIDYVLGREGYENCLLYSWVKCKGRRNRKHTTIIINHIEQQIGYKELLSNVINYHTAHKNVCSVRESIGLRWEKQNGIIFSCMIGNTSRHGTHISILVIIHSVRPFTAATCDFIKGCSGSLRNSGSPVVISL